MKNQVWCEDIFQDEEGFALVNGGIRIAGSGAVIQFKFCPLCAAPRPVEKSLRDILDKYTIPRKGFGDAFDYCQQEIEEHYRGKV